ncbi:MAG: EI24 domain-containing protein [Paracoccus sp. (in: a-proteobacteria)]|uniref:EI24 domain-containing protein n=1 Tax=Paracoccus sp. TaxID=267 RepID=UPI0026DF0749|nr:EI24 domain-containing protein [Paracoccus sp. (in: a-proteobacteria)]MDO5613132.1 EI24 domain-containing protein [Paracoccus sp. (in: a-proteobacteria)]
MVFIALSRALTDMLRPRIFGIVLTGIALTIGLFIALQAVVFFLIRTFVPGGFTLPFWGPIDFGTALSWASLALFPLIGFFLMAPVAAAFSGLFAENVANAVEETHYPHAKGQSLDFMDGLLESMAVMGAVIVVALLSLITMPILGPFSPVLFYGANGWLLGRELFQMAARRHLHEPQATALRQVNNTRITWAGVLIALLLTVPVLNIVVPVLAAAAFTHLFHLIRATTPRTR